MMRSGTIHTCDCCGSARNTIEYVSDGTPVIRLCPKCDGRDKQEIARVQAELDRCAFILPGTFFVEG